MPTVRVLWCSIRAYGGQVLYWLGHGETEVGDAGQSSVARGGPPRSAAEGSKRRPRDRRWLGPPLRRAALEAFVATPRSVLEQREKLEQLRALALGMHVAVAVVDTVPLGVDTEADLERARVLLENS